MRAAPSAPTEMEASPLLGGSRFVVWVTRVSSLDPPGLPYLRYAHFFSIASVARRRAVAFVLTILPQHKPIHTIPWGVLHGPVLYPVPRIGIALAIPLRMNANTNREGSMSHYSVVVGNVGEVLKTSSVIDAVDTYNAYVIRSKSNRGRCAGEPVTLFQDDSILYEYAGTIDQS